jgi:hypothetical protein
MTDAARKVLAGFVRLTHDDQREAIEAMNRFLRGNPEERSLLRRDYETAVMGPEGSGCPCCGRTGARP